MIDSHEIKLGVLQDLMDKMRELDGDRIKPKGVEIEVSSMKPEIELAGHEHAGSKPEIEEILGDSPDADEALKGAEPVDAGPGFGKAGSDDDGDELSPEDIELLEKLLSQKEGD